MGKGPPALPSHPQPLYILSKGLDTTLERSIYWIMYLSVRRNKTDVIDWSHTEITSQMTRCWNESIRTGNSSQWWKLANWSSSVTYHAALQSRSRETLLGATPGLRRQGEQRKQWTDNLTEWSNKSIPNLVRMAPDRSTLSKVRL